VRENTVISDAEQDHLPFARPWNDLFASQRVARREANPKEPCCPRPGRNLDKKKRFSENPLIPFSGQSFSGQSYRSADNWLGTVFRSVNGYRVETGGG